MRARKRDEGEQAERSEARTPSAERTDDAARRRRARNSTADRVDVGRGEGGGTRDRDDGDGDRARERGSAATRRRADEGRAGSDENEQAAARPTRRGSRRRGSGARGGSSRAGGDGSRGAKGDADGKGGKGDAGGKSGGATKGGKSGKGGQGRSRSAPGNRNQRQRKKGVGFWGETPKLPDVETDVHITNDPDAVPRSLGPPPLPGHETIAEHYFGVVYHRAVTTAGALAAAGGLIDPAALSDEVES